MVILGTRPHFFVRFLSFLDATLNNFVNRERHCCYICACNLQIWTDSAHTLHMFCWIIAVVIFTVFSYIQIIHRYTKVLWANQETNVSYVFVRISSFCLFVNGAQNTDPDPDLEHWYIKKLQNSRNQGFFAFIAWWWKDLESDPYLWLTDPDPRGTKTYGSGCGSGSKTVLRTVIHQRSFYLAM